MCISINENGINELAWIRLGVWKLRGKMRNAEKGRSPV